MVVTVAKRPVGFVVQLELKRVALGLGHGAWARRLGIDRSLWYRLLHGQRPVTMELIRRAVDEWPEDFRHLAPVVRADGNGNGGEQVG